jgi:lambda repressor-like predicted transcriptional regulator
MKANRLTITSVVAAGAVLAGGGAALAHDGKDTTARCDARLAKLAEKKGVSVEQLTTDLKAKATAKIDAAEQAGRITAEQAAAKRAAIAQGTGTGCTLVGKKAKGLRAKAKGLRLGMLAGAADYLGLSRAELKAELKQGTTLAELAAAKGKAVDGLKSAMLAKAKDRLAEAVAKGRITAEQSAKRLARLTTLVDKIVAQSFVKQRA